VTNIFKLNNNEKMIKIICEIRDQTDFYLKTEIHTTEKKPIFEIG